MALETGRVTAAREIGFAGREKLLGAPEEEATESAGLVAVGRPVGTVATAA